MKQRATFEMRLEGINWRRNVLQPRQGGTKYFCVRDHNNSIGTALVSSHHDAPGKAHWPKRRGGAVILMCVWVLIRAVMMSHSRQRLFPLRLMCNV